jgi:hypothetical protein
VDADRRSVLERLLAWDTPALFIVAGQAYEGHVLGVIVDVVVAFCRPLGTRESRQEYRWRLAELDDVGPALTTAVEEPEDPLQALGRELAAQARDDASLAERLLSRKSGKNHLEDV